MICGRYIHPVSDRCVSILPQIRMLHGSIHRLENTVCIATNGSAVLGFGNIGNLPAMPVMEGKSLILKKMSGVNCVPLLLDSDSAARYRKYACVSCTDLWCHNGRRYFGATVF